MSDPFRDAAARQAGEDRERVRDEYTPIVLWVKTPEGTHVREIRGWLKEQIKRLPYVKVATKDEPYQYATDGAIRVEDADGSET